MGTRDEGVERALEACRKRESISYCFCQSVLISNIASRCSRLDCNDMMLNSVVVCVLLWRIVILFPGGMSSSSVLRFLERERGRVSSGMVELDASEGDYKGDAPRITTSLYT